LLKPSVKSAWARPLASRRLVPAHRYGVTFVTADGETELGTVTSAVTVSDKTVNGKVSLSAIPTGGSAVTSRKIYRTVAGGSTYLLLTTLADNTTTTYTDNTADSGLGAQAPATNSTSNPELVSWIQAAREIGETFTRRRWIEQVVDWQPACPPCGSEILRLPFGNVTAVSSITYVDTNGTSTPFTTFRTNLPTGPKCSRGQLEPTYGYTWPSTRDVIGNFTVRLTAGYGSARSSVPESLKTGMKALIGHWDRSREAVNIGNITTEVPMGVKFCWKPFQTF
jgi:uncharacterized phiE125 gp8 family phage protein